MTVGFGNNPFLNTNSIGLIALNALQQVQSSASMSFDFSNIGLSLPGFDFTKSFNFDLSNFNFDISSLFTAQQPSSTQSSGPAGTCRPDVKLDKAFLDKVKQIAQRINCDYKDLLAVMNSESGLKTTAKNPNGGATGLIQFMPATARSLGTSTAALSRMSAVQQLDYVEKYFQKNIKTFGLTGKRLTAGDLYTLTFMPAKVKGEVLCSRGSKEYRANSGLDTNKDGQITKTELGNRVMRKRVDESIFA